MKTVTLKNRKYAQRARRRFCGASRETPAELVLSGKRSLEEWVEVLMDERMRHSSLQPACDQNLKRAEPAYPSYETSMR